jgi:membrane protein YqaA with SNARE-associated domain
MLQHANSKVMARMAPLIELLSLLLFTFGINMIPFASPSNLLIASNAALLVNSDPLSIGVLVALGSTCAKLIHYTISFFVGKRAGEKRRRRLDIAAAKTRRWAFPAILVAAATPIPDDPIIIPLGLMKYNPVKFTLAYFTGKLTITVAGAFLGGLGDQFLSGYLSQGVLAIISVILTIAITVVLLKVDLSGTAEQLLKKLGWVKNDKHPKENYQQ